ncbi:hypothetical protein B0F88_103237 [Methylobacter tundripaludum]|uniref:Uncharacterized protein n=1 Tax=Methylobacter tundripaludum TaxID=173365 RepID=A0A2S6H5N5_9GAMM|nr:hypothetical protein B0F88_103237 [Methylobacter tundripaludum]
MRFLGGARQMGGNVEASGIWSAGFACKHKRSLHSCCNELSSILNDDMNAQKSSILSVKFVWAALGACVVFFNC